MLTLAKINKAISHMGDITLFKGKDYFYFIGNNVSVFVGSIYVTRVNDLTIDEWINEAKHAVIELN